LIELNGKVVLLTGAAGEIGTATARTLVGAGARVVLHDLSTVALAPLMSELGAGVAAVAADLSDPLSTGPLWTEAVAAFGRIDVLVNNAGIYPPAPLDQPLDEWVAVWERSLAVNLVSPGALSRFAVEAFAAQEGGGAIISLASRAALRGEDPDFWHYAAAKAGIVAMTKTIARHYGRQGVTAFALAPGYVDTAFNRVTDDPDIVAKAAEQTGLGEVAMPQDIANVIAFLASGLARHMTGATLDINGASYVR
jgi:NAD(P)-dependent dehydrogenase (short-subunit alcohol dehydrogenase family)